jgi:hypothetical protein
MMTLPENGEPAAGKRPWPPGYWERLEELGPPGDDFVPPEREYGPTSRDEYLDELFRLLDSDLDEEKPA